MYFTIDEREPSSAIQDARRSFNTLRGHAHILADLSASFSEQAREATAAYRVALDGGDERAWVRLVRAAAELSRHGESIERLLGLGEAERLAWRFFRQIADENADLLESELVLAVA
jgi:hypothetical protein